MKVTPLNQFRGLQILWLFPARSSDTGTAGTGIEILGSCSAHPLGRNLFIRGSEHTHDVAKKAVDKPLWKHILDKHDGVMARPVFSQFKMDATQFFKSAQRRKANEGVRIANLDPATRMNSCNEFRQGTNIMMRPVRGVGV